MRSIGLSDVKKDINCQDQEGCQRSIRNCAWKVIELKRIVKLFRGIAHNSCSEDRALQTSRKRVVTVSKACVTPVMLPGTTKIPDPDPKH